GGDPRAHDRQAHPQCERRRGRSRSGSGEARRRSGEAMRKGLRAVFAVACLLLVSGCSFKPQPFPSEFSVPSLPPIEVMNKKVFWLNDQLDIHALEPVARGWDWMTPDP